MAMLWEAARLATLPATSTARAGLWAASCGWQVLVAPLPRLTAESLVSEDRAPSKTVATTDETGGALRFMSIAYWWDFWRRGLAYFGRLASLTCRLSLAIALACIFYALPVCGTSLRTPLHLLPMHLGADAVAEVEVGHWATTLAAGSVVVDVDFEMTVPNSEFNLKQSMEAAMRVDLDLEQKQVSRPLVLPRLSPAAQHIQELFWAVPMAFGFCYDEKVIRLSLATGLLPQDLMRPTTSNPNTSPDLWGFSGTRLALEGGSGGLARLRLTPALAVRSAHIRFQPRCAGPLGRLLSNFLGFVPICACLIYLGRYGRSDAPSPHDQRVACQGSSAKVSSKGAKLSYVEVQMLAKALGGSFTANFSATLEAFEAEDRAAHGGELRGKVKLDRLPMITGRAEHEWQVAFDEWELRNVIGTTLALPPREKGLVTPGGCLQYRLWLAVTTVSLLCGDRKFADYADWMEQHECATNESMQKA